MTKFGKTIVIISCVIIAIIIIMLFLFFKGLNINADFILVEKGYREKPAYLIESLGTSGKYYVECTSGYGVLQIDSSRYNLRNEKIQIKYYNNFLNDYYSKGWIIIPEGAIISIGAQSKEDFVVNFTFIGE